MPLNRFVPPKPRGRGVPAGRTMNQIRRYVIRQARQTYNNVVTPTPNPIPKGLGLLGRVGGGILTWAIDQLIFTPSAAVGTIPDWISDIPEQQEVESGTIPWIGGYDYARYRAYGEYFVTTNRGDYRYGDKGYWATGEWLGRVISTRWQFVGSHYILWITYQQAPGADYQERQEALRLSSPPDYFFSSTVLYYSENSTSTFWRGKDFELKGFIRVDGEESTNPPSSGKILSKPSSFPPSLGKLPDAYVPPTLSNPRLFLPPPREPKIIIVPDSLSDLTTGTPPSIIIENPPPSTVDFEPPTVTEQEREIRGKLTQTFLQSSKRPSAWLINQSSIGANNNISTKITKKYVQTNEKRIAAGGGGVKTDVEQELEKELAEQTKQELELQTDKEIDLTQTTTDTELFRQTVVEILRGYQPQLEQLVEQSLQQITPSSIRDGICQETLPDGCITQALEEVLNNQPSNNIELDETLLDLLDKLNDDNLNGEEVEDEEIIAENIKWVLVDIVKTPHKGKVILNRNPLNNDYFAGYLTWIVSVSSGRYHLPQQQIRKAKSAFKAPFGVVGYNMYAVNGASLRAKVYIQKVEE